MNSLARVPVYIVQPDHASGQQGQRTVTTIDPIQRLRPRRRPVGMSAILLPFEASGEVDWAGFRGHVERTAAAGLIPAVNMDTGYGNLIPPTLKLRVLAETQSVVGPRGRFVAGAFVPDSPCSDFDLAAYQRAIEPIQHHGGVPVIVQSHGLSGSHPHEVVEAYTAIGKTCGEYYAFELGQMFAPFGRIYDLETYGEILKIPQCLGAKHSSLERMPEWQRLELRDRVRPDFLVLTGNDLAVDMIMYGSDYLLGLSTFCPELFAKRDSFWADGDTRFYELNDIIQYLGFFAFRPPVPAYKHTAAMFLHLRGWIATPQTHPQSPTRPESDRPILQDILDRLTPYLR